MRLNLKGVTESISRGILRDSGAIFIYRIVGMALSFLAILLISKLFGAEGYGRFTLAFTVLQFLAILVSLGLPLLSVKLTADSQYFAEGRPKNNYFLKSALLVLGSGVLGSLIVYILKEWMARAVFDDLALEPYFLALSMGLGIVALHAFLSEYNRGRQRFHIYGLTTYTLPFLLFVLALLAVSYFNLPESSIFFCYIGSIVLIFGFLLTTAPQIRWHSGLRPSYLDLLKHSFPMMFSMAFVFVTNWTDVFMLGAMVSKAEVGIYNVAYKVAAVVLVVINAVNTVLAPKISRLYGNSDLAGLKNEVLKATRLTTYSTIPILIVLYVFRHQILRLFGNEYVEGEIAFTIILIGLFFNAISGSVGQVMNMTFLHKQLRNFTIVSVIVNIILNYFLIRWAGINGAAVASLLGNLLLNLMCIIEIRRKLGFITFFRLGG